MSISNNYDSVRSDGSGNKVINIHDGDADSEDVGD